MNYAAYGSNLHPLRLKKRLSSAKFLGTGFVSGWELRFHKWSKDKSGKCNIVPGGDGIYVAVFDISVEDKETLDQIEGPGYTAIAVDIPEFGDCACYVADESQINDSVAPYDWYKELVLLGARAHDFPNNYISLIDSITAREDPDRDRRARQWQVVDSIVGVT